MRCSGGPLRAQATVPSMQKHGGQNAEGLRVAQRKLPPLRMPTTSGAPPLMTRACQGGAEGGAPRVELNHTCACGCMSRLVC